MAIYNISSYLWPSVISKTTITIELEWFWAFISNIGYIQLLRFSLHEFKRTNAPVITIIVFFLSTFKAHTQFHGNNNAITLFFILYLFSWQEKRLINFAVKEFKPIGDDVINKFKTTEKQHTDWFKRSPRGFEHPIGVLYFRVFVVKLC